MPELPEAEAVARTLCALSQHAASSAATLAPPPL